MNIESLPVEILEYILKKLPGREVVSCRRVSRRWLGIIDSFTDSTWEVYCRQDFQRPQPVKNPANLSYRDLYKSLTLWDKVENAEQRIIHLPMDDTVLVQSFHVFNNRLSIATVQPSRHRQLSFPHSFSDTIHYYNPVTLEFISREHYPLLFKDYDENEHMISLVDDINRLHIIIKSNHLKNVYNLYDNNCDFRPGLSPHTMVTNTVYFLNSKRVMCVAELIVGAMEDKRIIETKELCEMGVSFIEIVAFAQAGRHAVNILVLLRREPMLHIYCIRENSFNVCGQIDNTTPNIILKLKEFGFRLNDLNITKWRMLFDRNNQVKISKMFKFLTIVHTHSETVFMGEIESLDDNQWNRTFLYNFLHIFTKAYNKNGDLITYDQKPNRSIVVGTINLRNVIYTTGVQKLEVVEILNGHRIIVLCESKLSFCDLLHEQ